MKTKKITEARIKKWFGNRMPVSDSIILQQRSTYILPTKAGLFMLLIVIVMMVGATNYQNNLAFLLTFLVAGIGLVSILFTFNNLQGLIFSKGKITSVCVGGNIEVVVNVTSQTEQNHLTVGCGFSKKTLTYFNVNGQSGERLLLSYKATKRGWLYLPRIMSTSNYPFGLLRVWSWFKFKSATLIYPQPIKPPHLTGFIGTDDEDGNNKIIGIEELYGLKAYQTGDLISRIDWKAVAREKGVFTKDFVSFQRESLNFNWNDLPSKDGETKLSYLCYLILEANSKQLDYSLSIPNKKINQSSGSHHLKQCLDALAMYGMDSEMRWKKLENE